MVLRPDQFVGLTLSCLNKHMFLNMGAEAVLEQLGYRKPVANELYSNKQTDKSEKTAIQSDTRTFLEVALKDIQNLIYFFAPLVIIHLSAWTIKPLLTSDERGPWEILWCKVVDKLGEDRYFYYVWGTFTVTTGVYWISAGIYAFMDFTQKPKFLMKYKIQPDKNVPLDTKLFFKVVTNCLINQAEHIPMLMLEYRRWSINSNADIRYIPDAYTTFGTLFVCMIFHDIFFYHCHRLLHHKSLYKHIHKKHHEWQAPIAATAVYMNPIEHFFIGIISPGIGTMIMAPQLPVSWLWFCWITFQVQNDHSGYHFPLVFSPEFHDYHHLKFHTSYGWLSFWDWFYGTDIEFQKTELDKKRHFRIHSLESAREIVPNVKSKSM